MDLIFKGNNISDIDYVRIHEVNVPMSLQQRRVETTILGAHGTYDLGNTKYDNFFITARGSIMPVVAGSLGHTEQSVANVSIETAYYGALAAIEEIQRLLVMNGHNSWGHLVVFPDRHYRARVKDLILPQFIAPGRVEAGEPFPAYEFEILFECKPFRIVEGETTEEIEVWGYNELGGGTGDIRVKGSAPTEPYVSIEFNGGFGLREVKLIYKNDSTGEEQVMVLGHKKTNILDVGERIDIDCSKKEVTYYDRDGYPAGSALKHWKPGSQFWEFGPGKGSIKVEAWTRVGGREEMTVVDITYDDGWELV